MHPKYGTVGINGLKLLNFAWLQSSRGLLIHTRFDDFGFVSRYRTVVEAQNCKLHFWFSSALVLMVDGCYDLHAVIFKSEISHACFDMFLKSFAVECKLSEYLPQASKLGAYTQITCKWQIQVAKLCVCVCAFAHNNCFKL